MTDSSSLERGSAPISHNRFCRNSDCGGAHPPQVLFMVYHCCMPGSPPVSFHRVIVYQDKVIRIHLKLGWAATGLDLIGAPVRIHEVDAHPLNFCRNLTREVK